MQSLEIGMPAKLLPNKSNPLKDNGFTLLEILVVLVIIGITLGFALLSFGDFGQSRRLHASAEQFASSVKYAQQRALIESNAYTIEIHKTYYLIAPHRSQTSIRHQNQHRYPFPKGSTANLIVNPKENRIVINSAGEFLPFQILIQAKSASKNIRIIGDDHGKLELKQS